MTSLSDAQKQRIFSNLAKHIEKSFGQSPEYGEGVITAYTLLQDGREVLELQTDFGDHLDLLLVVDGHPYSLGGDYVHGENAWRDFDAKARHLIDVLSRDRMVQLEEWYRGKTRIGGRAHVHAEGDNGPFTLIDRTGKSFILFARTVNSDRVIWK